MVLAAGVLLISLATSAPAPKPQESPGGFYIVGKERVTMMALERTSVDANIAGMGARVTVRQVFTNPSETPIEAVYKFPLPHDAAVDQMRIQVGNRVIEGEIMRREQARQVYEKAKSEGKVASLLDQETDNIFTQSVANILPGRKITVEISYVQVLRFEAGEYEFTFPMVVGPRYLGAGTPNPGAIDPPRMAVGVRSGQNIDLTATIRGGSPVRDFRSILHAITTKRWNDETIQVRLAKKDEIPNRDFILRYRTATNEIQDSLLTTWDPERGGYFALILSPPPKPTPQQRAPKQMVFVIDQSGSQSGFPIDKSKELALQLLDTMGPQDEFNVMGFSNGVNPLWPGPRPNSELNRTQAKTFIRSLEASGGTELERAIVASLSSPVDPTRVRMVVFNTDGLAGQESVILRNIQQYRGLSRLFTFGIGNSVNRSLIDAMSYEGRGASDIVTTEEEAKPAVRRFAQRMDQPLLVDVVAKFTGKAVEQVTPKQLPDVFSAKPVVIYGRYSQPGKTEVTLTGLAAGKPWARTIELDLPTGEGDGSSVSSLWARARIAELKSQSYTASALGQPIDVKSKIMEVALDHRLMSEYTSFVAVDRPVSNPSGKNKTVLVPVEAADKVGGQGGRRETTLSSKSASVAPMTFGMAKGKPSRVPGAAGGFGGGGAAADFRGGSAGLPANAAGGRFQGGGADYAEGLSRQIDFISYDPSDNSLVVGGEAKRGKDVQNVEVESGLLKKKGKFDVRVLVTNVTPQIIEALRKAGFRTESHDGRVELFGTATADLLRAIAKVKGVLAIQNL
ncbi:MAG: VIT domain-containing protein [Fimbriimonas sp.]